MTPQTLWDLLRQIDDETLNNLSCDITRYGSGYLKVNSKGAKWLPMHEITVEIVDTAPSAGDQRDAG